MPLLFLGLVTLVERLIAWWITKGIKVGAYFLGYVTFAVAAFTAFLALVYATVSALKPIAPDGVGFALAILPPSTGAYISAYLTVLVAKRVYDWHKQITRDFTQATLRF